MRNLIIKPTITCRDEVSLSRYFNEVEKISLLTLEEEENLCRRVLQGDHAALRKLVVANLRFVISVAKQYQSQGLSLNDLISEGNIGLIKAAYRFDHTKGFRFISYAVWWIRQAVATAVEEHRRLIRLPLNQVMLLNQYRKTASRQEQELQRRPSTSEVAIEIGVDDHRLAELLENTQVSTSLDQPLGGDNDMTLYGCIAQPDDKPDAHLIRESVTVEVMEALGVLNQREREILLLYFGLQGRAAFRLEEIAERFSLSVEHTRRLKDGALEKLRNSEFAQQLKSCFI